MGDDLMITRFPDGLKMLMAALRREGIQREQVQVQLHYYSWSWSLQVICREYGYKRIQQLPPEDLRADTSFSELCDSIAEELGDRKRAVPTS